MFIETHHLKFQKLRRSEMFFCAKIETQHSNSTYHSYGVHELLELCFFYKHYTPTELKTLKG